MNKYGICGIVAGAIAWALMPAAFAVPGDGVEAAKPEAAAAAAAPAAPAPGEKKEPPKEAVKEPGLKINLRATNVNINSYLNIDEQGKVQNQQNYMYVNCNGRIEGEAIAVSVQDLKVTEATTDAGETLTPNEQNNRGQRWARDFSPGNQNQLNQFNINFNFGVPVRPAKKIREITGTFEVVLAEPPMREAVLEPLGKIDGRRIRIEGVPNSAFIVSRQGKDGRVRVSYNQALKGLMSAMRFFGAGGTEFSGGGWGGGGDGGMEYREFNYKMPDEGKVVLTLFTGTRTISVPFKIVDVPIPRPEGEANQADLVFEAKRVPLAGGGGEKGKDGQKPLDWVLEK